MSCSKQQQKKKMSVQTVGCISQVPCLPKFAFVRFTLAKYNILTYMCIDKCTRQSLTEHTEHFYTRGEQTAHFYAMRCKSAWFFFFSAHEHLVNSIFEWAQHKSRANHTPFKRSYSRNIQLIRRIYVIHVKNACYI